MALGAETPIALPAALQLSSTCTNSGKNALSGLFLAVWRPWGLFPARLLRPSCQGGVPMDACRLAAASVPVGEQGCGKSGKRPVAADLGVGLFQ